MNSELMPYYCVLMRGGTSKGIFLHENDLPQDPVERDKVILSIFGSPDPRQIDGLGGAEPLTSKLAIIGPPSRPDADVDYTFGQVEINMAKIHYSGLCGNISSAVGPYAIEEGLVRATDPITRVRVHSKNTNQIFIAEVPVRDGKPRVNGDYKVDGVPGTGSHIQIDMVGTVGSVAGKLLPTGHVKDKIQVDGLGEITVSIIDVTNPCIFVHAKELGLKGYEAPNDIKGNTTLLENVEKIRAIGAKMIGIKDWGKSEVKDPIPFLVFVSPPRDYVNHLTKETIQADSVDFLARLIFLGVMHQTFAGSVSCATGTAAVIPGSVVNEVARLEKGQEVVRLGHPGGVIEVEAEGEEIPDQGFSMKRVTYGRTARRIMDGHVYVRQNV
ncbi:MAG TPA: PrpF domain-containing protein [Negativicutes bacterium]|jgi:hypothetical protein